MSKEAIADDDGCIKEYPAYMAIQKTMTGGSALRSLDGSNLAMVRLLHFESVVRAILCAIKQFRPRSFARRKVTKRQQLLQRCQSSIVLPPANPDALGTYFVNSIPSWLGCMSTCPLVGA